MQSERERERGKSTYIASELRSNSSSLSFISNHEIGIFKELEHLIPKELNQEWSGNIDENCLVVLSAVLTQSEDRLRRHCEAKRYDAEMRRDVEQEAGNIGKLNSGQKRLNCTRLEVTVLVVISRSQVSDISPHL